MRRGLRARIRVLVTVCLVGSMSAISLVSVATQAAADGSGQAETVLPALPDPVPPEYALQAASSSGVVANNAWTDLATGATTGVDASIGNILGYSSAGSDVYVENFLTAGGGTGYQRTDLTTGAVVPFQVPTGYQNVGLAGSEVLELEEAGTGGSGTPASLHLDQLGVTGVTGDTTVTGWPDGQSPTSASLVASDQTTAAVSFGLVGGGSEVGLVDLATGQLQLVPQVTSLRSFAMDGTDLAWLTGYTTVSVLSLQDLGAAVRTVELPQTFDNYTIGLSGPDLLVTRNEQAGYDNPVDPVGAPLLSFPIAGGAPTTLLPHAENSLLQGPDGSVLAVGGSSSTDWWVQTVNTAANGTSTVVHDLPVAPVPEKVESLSAAGGLVSASYDNTTGYDGFSSWALPTTATGQVQGPTTMSQGVAYGACGSYEACTRQQVWATADGRVEYSYFGTVALRAGLPQQTIAGVGGNTPAIEGAFGRYVLQQDTALHVGEFGSGTTGQIVLNEPLAPAALWGHLLYTADGTNGEVKVIDVRTQQPVATVQVGSDCTIFQLQVVDHWLFRQCSNDSATYWSAVFDLDSQQLIPIPNKDMGQQAMLGDGFLVVQAPAEGLELVDFHTGSPVLSNLGVKPYQPAIGPRAPWTVDQYGGRLAYLASDQSLHVLPLGVPTSALTAPDDGVPTTLDLRTAGAAWTPNWWLSKPAASWALDVTSTATGQVVAALSGGTARGVISPSWDGKDTQGKLLPTGSYQWTLTATPADGQGAPLSASGNVQVTSPPAAPLTPSIGYTVNAAQPGAALLSFEADSPFDLTGGSVTFGDGQSTSLSGGTGTLTHAYAKPGTYTVAYTASDAGDRTAKVTRQVTVGASFVPFGPMRILDTRYGTGAAKAPVGAGKTLRVKVAGADGLPSSGITAVTLNLTDTDATASDWITAYADGGQRLNTSNLNFQAGQTNPNEVTVPVGADGYIDLYNANGSTDLFADVQGYYTVTANASTAQSDFVSVTAKRVMDTRYGTGAPKGPVGAGRVIRVQVPPLSVSGGAVTAVVLNVTAVGATTSSWVTAFSGGGSVPNASNLNFHTGQTVSNLVVVPVGGDGTVELYNHAGYVNLFADVQGYYATGTSGGQYVAVNPTRVVDTRYGTGAPKQAIGAGKSLKVNATATGEVPASASAVMLNLTGSAPSSSTWLIAGANSTPNDTSNVDLVPGQTRPVLAAVPLSNGSLYVYNARGTVSLFADVDGYFG